MTYKNFVSSVLWEKFIILSDEWQLIARLLQIKTMSEDELPTNKLFEAIVTMNKCQGCRKHSKSGGHTGGPYGFLEKRQRLRKLVLPTPLVGSD